MLCLLMLYPLLLAAQIRLVPQERLDSIRNPQTFPSELRFSEPLIEMGTIPEAGGLWTRQIEWQNAEQTPVVITSIRTTCGCLKAAFSPEPLKRGEWGSIEVKYNPKGHPGAVDQRLFVYTSLSDRFPSAIIRLVGHVQADSDRKGDYPYACGSLLLRQNELRYTGQHEIRVACMNGGRGELRITHDPLLGPRGVKIETSPVVLGPAAQGDLIIRFEGEPEFRTDGTLQLLLEGLQLPPRMRTLRLKRADSNDEK